MVMACHAPTRVTRPRTPNEGVCRPERSHKLGYAPMPKVVFTANLKRYTGGVTETAADGDQVCDLLHALETQIPGLRHYIVDDQGALRVHVNIFVDGSMVRDLATLTDPVGPDSTVHILQALSGG